MTYFVGTLISSIHQNSEITNQSDLEYSLGASVIHQVLFERAVYAYKYYKMIDAVSDGVGIGDVGIIGTNDEDLKLAIEAELQNLKLQYVIKENHVFAEESEEVDIYGNDENYLRTEKLELSASVKYMFLLTTTNLKTYDSPVYTRNGDIIEPKTDFQKFCEAIEMGYPGDFLPHMFYNDIRMNPKNLYYSTDIVDEEYINKSEAMAASMDILEVIALNYTDEVYYFIENRYEETFKNTHKDVPQYNNLSSAKKGLSGGPMLLITLCVVILFFASIFGN
jgi:hypothetical protein